MILLKPDNFTPLARTPWAGKQIARDFKQHLLAGSAPTRIGESWECSCDPDFPSLNSTGIALTQLIRERPEFYLGPHEECRILVKLLEASEPLSVQIHPEDRDPNLKLTECGKPESWYVIQAEPGAGLYLGFSRPMSTQELRTQVWEESHLQFVEVKAGDYFEIEPGVPHAIGPGVCLLEPQRILQGKSGKTYRMWDWNRKYLANGERDDLRGTSRELHLEAALRLVDPTRQFGIGYVDSLRRHPNVTHPTPNTTHREFPPNPHYQVHVIESRGESRWQIKSGYGVLTVLDGQLDTSSVGRIVKGQSCFVPFENGAEVFVGSALFSLVTSTGSTMAWS